MYSSHDITRLKKLSSNAKYYLEKLIPMSLVLLDLPEAAAFPSPSPHQLLHLASQTCTKQTFNNVNRVCIIITRYYHIYVISMFDTMYMHSVL